MLSPVGNRVSVFDLVKLVTVLCHTSAHNELTHLFCSNKSFTFPFQNRKNIAALALSPNGNILITVDEGAVTVLPVFIMPTYASRRWEGSPGQFSSGHCPSSFQFQKAGQCYRVFTEWIVHCCHTRIACSDLEDSEPPCPRICAIHFAPDVYRAS